MFDGGNASCHNHNTSTKSEQERLKLVKWSMLCPVFSTVRVNLEGTDSTRGLLIRSQFPFSLQGAWSDTASHRILGSEGHELPPSASPGSVVHN